MSTALPASIFSKAWLPCSAPRPQLHIHLAPLHAYFAALLRKLADSGRADRKWVGVACDSKAPCTSSLCMNKNCHLDDRAKVVVGVWVGGCLVKWFKGGWERAATCTGLRLPHADARHSHTHAPPPVMSPPPCRSLPGDHPGCGREQAAQCSHALLSDVWQRPSYPGHPHHLHCGGLTRGGPHCHHQVARPPLGVLLGRHRRQLLLIGSSALRGAALEPSPGPSGSDAPRTPHATHHACTGTRTLPLIYCTPTAHCTTSVYIHATGAN